MTSDLRECRKWMTGYMAELIVYGGVLATREEAFDDACNRIGKPQWASHFAFGPNVKVATPEQIASLPRLADVDRAIAEQAAQNNGDEQ